MFIAGKYSTMWILLVVIFLVSTITLGTSWSEHEIDLSAKVLFIEQQIQKYNTTVIIIIDENMAQVNN